MRRNTLNRLLVWFISASLFVVFLPFLILPESSSVHLEGIAAPTKLLVVPANIGAGSIRPTACALCFFGLPRSFELLVLPSIVRNILIPNKENRCDIYLHHYDVKEEKKDRRSGQGGKINSKEVEGLHEAVRKVYSNEANHPHVAIISDTDEEFWRIRGESIEKYRKAKGSDGKYLYYPWMARSYSYPRSIDNIVKQWHSIESVWRLMEKNELELGKNYTQVAMMRNDVLFATPFNVYNTSRNVKNTNLDYVGVPNWARYPINDRMVYGSYEAVKIWSTERFERLESHVLTYEPGYGMHSERFLNHSIFPAMQKLGIKVIENPDLCFFRTRADGTAWTSDCVSRNGAARNFRKINTLSLVESIVGRPCVQSKFTRKITQVQCNVQTAANTTV
eukprot:scaffold1830_cov117-Cylindrotheca_fusiformis.AAC.20